MFQTTLSPAALQGTLSRLRSANLALFGRFAGVAGARQPVHTVYGGAHLFKSDTARKLGAVALRAMEEHAPDFASFGRAIGLVDDVEGALPEDRAEVAALAEAFERGAEATASTRSRGVDKAARRAHVVHARVLEKLRREPVEDLRIDFEDGYGARPDREEDEHAVAAAREVARGMADASLPPFLGIRIKPLSEECRDRALRTLDLFVSTLVAASTSPRGALPPGFVVTLPKVAVVEHVAALVDIFEQLERGLGLPDGALKLEIMVETTAAIVGARGEIALPALVSAARGRCAAAHFGAYDYTAGCDITAPHQHLAHAACDFARHVMQVSLAGTGVWLSDGATNVLPIAPHRRPSNDAHGSRGAPLSARELDDNRRAVHAAWRLSFEHIQRALAHGFYQGWDLHPAQLPVRYAAVYAFFLDGLAPSAARLRNFVDRAAQATLAGAVFDDAATGQGLLNYFLRAISAGAMTEQEAAERSGLTPEELRGRSFLAIVEGRRA